MVDMSADPSRLRSVWDQHSIPVILRRTGKGERPRIRLPFDKANRAWLKGDKRTEPVWNASERYWEVPKKWFNDVVRAILDRYGQLYVIQPYREQEVCAPACWNATGYECQCSCAGENHGRGGDRSWLEVSEAFATRWGERQLGCRLMVVKR